MEQAAPVTWTADDESRLAELLAAEFDGEGLADYIRRVNPRMPPPPHVLPVIEALEEAREGSADPHGPLRIIVVEMPPRHAKTTTVLHALAWRIFRDPAVTNAYITYGDDLSASKSRMVRNLAIASGVQLAADMANLSEWRTVHGGGLLAGGIMGPLTGKGIDGVLVVDDPIKNREEAESQTYRDKVWDQFTDVVFTRLEGAACVVVMMTRWHPDDLIGRILDKQAELTEELGRNVIIRRIQLQAIAEADDPLGRPIGTALWAVRFNEARLNLIRKVVGEYTWASMFQQEPRARGAVLFASDNGLPSRFAVGTWVPNGHRMLIACDPAATAKTKSNYSAAYVLAATGWGATMEMWVVDGFRRQITIPELVRNLQALRERWYGIAIAVEAVAAFKSVPDMLREVDPTLPIIEVTPRGDKYVRAQPVAAAWNQGRVWVPADADWAAKMIHVCSVFTGRDDPEDDDVDALAHGWNELFDAIANEPERGPTPAPFLPFG
jgi:predicted phage terminase large subunit-like protein